MTTHSAKKLGATLHRVTCGHLSLLLINLLSESLLLDRQVRDQKRDLLQVVVLQGWELGTERLENIRALLDRVVLESYLREAGHVAEVLKRSHFVIREV